jgi:hypothetical protein
VRPHHPLAFCLLVATSLATPTVSGAIDVQIKSGLLQVSAAPPGGDLGVLGVDYLIEEPSLDQLVVVESIADGKGFGELEISLERPPGAVSGWLVVSAETGDFGLAAGSEGLLASFKANPGLVTGGVCPSTCFAADGHETLHLLLFRSGIGLWYQLLVDGGTGSESDEVDGRSVLAVPSWSPLGQVTGDPGDLQPDDVIFAIDPVTLEVGGWRIGDLYELP